MDIQLTWSKDGRSWHRAGNREPILECGPPGSHDSGYVYPPHAPFVHEDEIWLYHGSSNCLHGEKPRRDEKHKRGIHLAKIPRDRLVCLQTDGQGVATTLPLSIEPSELYLNVDATDGSAQVEIVDPFGRVIAGYSRQDCVPFSGNDTAHKVQWRDQTATDRRERTVLEEKMVSQSAGSLKVKLYLDNARVFAIYAG